MEPATLPVQAESFSYQQLLEEAQQHEELIERIKLEVAEDWDNLSQPVPFLQDSI